MPPIPKKIILAFIGSTLLACFHFSSSEVNTLLPPVDHLVYATPDLERGIAEVEELIGVRASPGGQHPGIGTRNALLSLGPGVYLEIIGPDPQQPAPSEPRPFGIDTLKASRLVTWAAAGKRLKRLRERAIRKRIPLGEVVNGSRQRPDGTTLSWELTDPAVVLGDGIIPFFIQWHSTEHPSSSSAPGARLLELRAVHPDHTRVQEELRDLGLRLEVVRGPVPELKAIIDGPRGRVVLR